MRHGDHYLTTLDAIKNRITSAQQTAVLSVNAQLLFLYWEVGQYIRRQQDRQGWGAKVISRLSSDLRSAFPDQKGFSVRNLKYMVKFAETYPADGMNVQPPAAQINMEVKVQPLAAQIDLNEFIHLPVAQIGWSHHIVLMDKTKSSEERLFYLKRTIEEGWSKRLLIHKIEQQLFEAQGTLPNNFQSTLSVNQAAIAREALKDPYIFDFLQIGEVCKERELEKALLAEITKFLLELGTGFAFLGQQYHLNLGGQDYYLDLIFYHTKLRSYFIIELKIDEFKPEYAGKLNFYINAADDLLKNKPDNETIGLLLCKSSNKVVVEYALKDLNKPIGVATYKLLPDEKDWERLLNPGSE